MCIFLCNALARDSSSHWAVFLSRHVQNGSKWIKIACGRFQEKSQAKMSGGVAAEE